MLIIVQKRLIKLINGRVISMSKSEKTLYAKKGDIVIDHFNENIINRPDPHSQLRFKIIESISKDGIVIIGIKEDDNGQFTSRDEALDWLRTNHEIRE